MKDDNFQRQQGMSHELIRIAGCHTDMDLLDTLIVWTEANVMDVAFSFQRPEGCTAIWYALQFSFH
jgi:hypothetical protein